MIVKIQDENGNPIDASEAAPKVKTPPRPTADVLLERCARVRKMLVGFCRRLGQAGGSGGALLAKPVANVLRSWADLEQVLHDIHDEGLSVATTARSRRLAEFFPGARVRFVSQEMDVQAREVYGDAVVAAATVDRRIDDRVLVVSGKSVMGICSTDDLEVVP